MWVICTSFNLKYLKITDCSDYTVVTVLLNVRYTQAIFDIIILIFIQSLRCSKFEMLYILLHLCFFSVYKELGSLICEICIAEGRLQLWVLIPFWLRNPSLCLKTQKRNKSQISECWSEDEGAWRMKVNFAFSAVRSKMEFCSL